MVDEHISQPAEDPAPAAPAETRPSVPMNQPERPATVERPIETTPAPVTPAPVTPPQTPPAAVEAPVEVPAVPPQAPPQIPPAESTDDLFNSTEPAAIPPAEPAAPAEAPAATDDLFGTEPAESIPPTDTIPPADEPAIPAEMPAEESTDDLFGGTEEPATAPASNDAPAETEEAAPPAEEPAEESTDDIFGAMERILHEAGGLASNEMRVWVDNTGSYSVNARLIRFANGHVQLLKENGRTTTVPLNRLSGSDLRFVNRQTNAQRATTMQTAQVSATMPGLAN